jgi:dolichol-phosphate mannosyltransferase
MQQRRRSPDPYELPMHPYRTVAYVLPVHDEVDNLGPLHEALSRAVAERPDLRFEFGYVDDGSRDGSLERLLELRHGDPWVTVLSLSRNVGHQVAVTAGLDAATDADAVVVMDTDLQDPPPVSLELVRVWEKGADVVYAQRRTRQDGLFKRATAYAFYWLLARLASIEIPRNVGDFRLMAARVVAEWCATASTTGSCAASSRTWGSARRRCSSTATPGTPAPVAIR